SSACRRWGGPRRGAAGGLRLVQHVVRGRSRGRDGRGHARGGTRGRGLRADASTGGGHRSAPGVPRPAARADRRGQEPERAGCGRPAGRPEKVTRVAAIDQGTNSTRLLVADVVDGDVEEVVRRSVVTRLGEGVDARRRLL